MLKYEQFKQSIRQYNQSSELDIGIVYFILKDLFNEIERMYYAQLNKESIESARQAQQNQAAEE